MTRDSAASNADFKATQRDDEFYIDLITFQVDGVLFRVPRRPFETESEVFKGMFDLPSSDASVEGSSDEHPLILHGVTAKDFRALLRALLNPMHGPQSGLRQEDWISVLALANLWDFQRLYYLAIDMLDGLPLTPVVKITLAKKYSIQKWLRPVYFDLVMRSDALTQEEGEVFGTACIIKLSKLRELRHRLIIRGTRDSESFPATISPTHSTSESNARRGRCVPASEIGLTKYVFPGYVESRFAEELKQRMLDAIAKDFGLE